MQGMIACHKELGIINQDDLSGAINNHKQTHHGMFTAAERREGTTGLTSITEKLGIETHLALPSEGAGITKKMKLEEEEGAM